MNFAKSPSVNNSFTHVQTQSLFGQINLAYKDAIFLDASLRNDWDSRLPKPYTFSYPSIGASAILSDLFKLPDFLSYLKASANYAEVGNGGRFGLLNPVYNYSQGAGNGFLQRGGTLPFPDLKPEIVRNIRPTKLHSLFIWHKIPNICYVYTSARSRTCCMFFT